MKAGARNEAGRAVWCGGKEAYGKAGWRSGSTPLGSSKLLGQLALKLWPSKTCLLFFVLPGFCLEWAKKLVCAGRLQFHVGTND